MSDKNPGEFDDLISALRTGDVFGDEISKLKVRKRTKKVSAPANLQSRQVREREAKPALKL